MSLTNISSSKNYPCYLLEINDVKIMLDCGLNYNNIRRFESGLWLKIPHFNTIEISSIDVVLITNHENIFALPFLTEMDGFRAKIYCSQPTMEFGRLLMLDMALSVDESDKTILDFEPQYDGEFKHSHNIQKVYNKESVIKSLSNVNLVAINEKINISKLTFFPVSSGFVIGSYSWIIETVNNKVVYMGKTSIHKTHAQCANFEYFTNCTVLILGFSIEKFDTYLSNYDKLLDVCRKNIAHNKSVLIPEFAAGFFFDFLSDIALAIHESSSFNTQIYFVSPVAHACISYANIYSEWLTKNLRDGACVPRAPFSFQTLLNSGKFVVANHPTKIEIRANSIIICSHKSMRCGAFLHYYNYLNCEDENILIITDPYLKSTPGRFLHQQHVHIPITNIINLKQFKKLMRVVHVDVLVSPEPVESIPGIKKVVTIEKLDMVDLDIHEDEEEVVLSSELANSISIRGLNCFENRTTFSSQISTQRDFLELNKIGSSFSVFSKIPTEEIIFEIDKFMKILNSTLLDVSIDILKTIPNIYIVKLNKQPILTIQVFDNRTNFKIMDDVEQPTNELIMEALSSTLSLPDS